MGWAAALPFLMQMGGMGIQALSHEHKPKINKLSNLTSEQRHLLKDVTKHPDVHMNLPNIKHNENYKMGGNYLQQILGQNPNDPNAAKQFEAPYMRQFQEEIMPQLAEQYAGAGAMGSSAFQNAAAHEGGSLMERLAALRGNLGLQQQGLGLQAAQQALGYAQLPFMQKFQQQGQEQNLGMARRNLALGAQPYTFTHQEGGMGPGGMIGKGLSSLGGGMSSEQSSGIVDWISKLFS